MKSLNRTLSLVLVLVMVLGLFGVAGASFKDDAKIKNETAVQTASALNIINGRENGNFDPEGIVTRGEMSKMICVALNGGVEPTLGTLASPSYTDIQGHWAEKYIEYCSGLAIVAGKGDGTFAPDATVTGTEAAKMLLVALGYISDYEGFTGAEWSVKVNTRAMQKGLYNDIAIDPSAGLTRDNAAQMVYNALYANMVKYTYGIAPNNGTVSGVATAEDETFTMLTKRYKLKENVKGYLVQITYNKDKAEYGYVINTQADGTGTDTTVVSKVDYSKVYGMKVKVFYKDKTDNGYTASDDTIYDILPDDSKIIATGNTGLMGVFSATDKTLKFGLAQTAYDLETIYAATYGQVSLYKAYDADPVTGLIADVGGVASVITYNAGVNKIPLADVTLIDNNGDGKIDTVVAIPFNVEKVNGVSTTNATLSTKGSVSLKDDTVYTGIAKNDIVRVYDSTCTAERSLTVSKENVLTATVSGLKGASITTQFQANGIWMLPTNADTMSNFALAPTTPGIGDEVEYVMVGALSPYVKITTPGAGSKDIAVVLNAATTSGVNAGLEVKLYFADGTNKVVTVAKFDSDESFLAATELNGLYGKAVTYKINSDGDYELKTIAAGNMAGYDFVSAAETYSTTTKKAGVYTIADDAVVFVIENSNNDTTMDNNNKMKVYTGKELKNSNVGAESMYVLAKDVNGFDTAKVVVLSRASALGITKAANYGYLTADTYQTNESGDDYLTFTYWNGTDTVTAKWKSADSPALYAKGSLITFDTGDTGVIKNVKAFTATVDAKVKGWNSEKATGNIEFTGISTTYKITADTVIFYANTKDKVGSTGSIQEALADNNVRFSANASDEVEFILVDVNQKIV